MQKRIHDLFHMHTTTALHQENIPLGDRIAQIIHNVRDRIKMEYVFHVAGLCSIDIFLRLFTDSEEHVEVHLRHHGANLLVQIAAFLAKFEHVAKHRNALAFDPHVSKRLERHFRR